MGLMALRASSQTNYSVIPKITNGACQAATQARRIKYVGGRGKHKKERATKQAI